MVARFGFCSASAPFAITMANVVKADMDVAGLIGLDVFITISLSIALGAVLLKWRLVS